MRAADRPARLRVAIERLVGGREISARSRPRANAAALRGFVRAFAGEHLDLAEHKVAVRAAARAFFGKRVIRQRLRCCSAVTGLSVALISTV